MRRINSPYGVVAVVLALVGVAGTVALRSRDVAANAGSRAIFERRILPLFKTQQASSCAECHLGGVDLKDYIADTEEQTFLSLRDQGLVNLKRPDDSKLLKLIQMSSPRSSLVNRKVRQQEYEAFRDWIRASAGDPKLAAAPALPAAKRRTPPVPLAVIRHGRIDRVLSTFEQTVWAQQQRCAACHAAGGEQHAKLLTEHGDKVTWMVAGDAQGTLARVIERGLIDADAPDKSTLLLKPTNQVPHGGGVKMVRGDAGYKSFRRFIEDYAAITRGEYKDAQQLPPAPGERFVSSQYWLKLENTPAEWGDRLLGLDLYPWDPARNDWSPRRVATSDRGVFGKGRLWQHNVDLVLPAGQPGAALPDLSHGRYLVQIYVNREGELEKNWQRELHAPDFYVGELVVEPGWRPGYGAMKVISAATPAKRRSPARPE